MCCSTLKIGKILFILGIYLLQLGKKTYFLALGTIPMTGVGFIGRKITVELPVELMVTLRIQLHNAHGVYWTSWTKNVVTL